MYNSSTRISKRQFWVQFSMEKNTRMKDQRESSTVATGTFFTVALLTFALTAFPAPAQENGKSAPPPATAAASPETLTGTGHAGYLAVWQTTTQLGSSLFLQKSGDVGLGTTTPKAVLDVETANTVGTPAIMGGSNGTSGNAVGVQGVVNSDAASPDSVAGVSGISNATSGNTAGVVGTDYNPSGVGVFGQAVAATSAGQRGVEGIAYGPGGVGVRGDATGNSTNLSAGVVAVANGPIDIGMQSFATSTSGQTTGLAVYDYSATGTAGLFYNNAGGNVLVGQNGSGNVFRVDDTGKGYFDGGTQTGGADFAESVAVLGDRLRYQPGDLLAIDPTGHRRLALSQDPYSTRVAGIYSTKPGILATTHRMDDSSAASEVPLAVMGIVPCRVTAENGAIGVGDLLVSSSQPGQAMKGTDRSRMLGAVVGKALDPLATGTGVIQVLVTLQ